MSENDFDKNVVSADPENSEPQIIVNDYGSTKDTETETIVFEKGVSIDIAPKNRPRKVYAGMWGPTEIATAGSAFLAVLTVVLLYIFMVVPSNRELEKNRADRDRLEKELILAEAKYGDISSTETQVAKLIASVDDFESSYLPAAVIGKTALYQRINGLIVAFGLTNTSGPDYVPLELADQNKGNQPDEERGKTKFRSLFPGVYVTTTVEGSYQNIRRFISEIETGREFVVVSSVELEPSETEQKTDSGAAPVQTGAVGNNFPSEARPPGFSGVNNPNFGQPTSQSQQAKVRGKTHGETVRLRLELAAYFRRSDSVPIVSEVQAQ